MKIIQTNRFKIYQEIGNLYLTCQGKLGQIGIQLIPFQNGSYLLGKVITWLTLPLPGKVFRLNDRSFDFLIKKKIRFINSNVLEPHFQLLNLLINFERSVSIGFSTQLIIKGIGYKFGLANDKLQLFVGKSHVIHLNIPKDLRLTIPTKRKDQELVLFGLNKKDVRRFSAFIRSNLPPEIYKGKGIRYYNERILLKQTKKN